MSNDKAMQFNVKLSLSRDGIKAMTGMPHVSPSILEILLETTIRSWAYIEYNGEVKVLEVEVIENYVPKYTRDQLRDMSDDELLDIARSTQKDAPMFNRTITDASDRLDCVDFILAETAKGPTSKIQMAPVPPDFYQCWNPDCPVEEFDAGAATDPDMVVCPNCGQQNWVPCYNSEMKLCERCDGLATETPRVIYLVPIGTISVSICKQCIDEMDGEATHERKENKES